MIAMLNRKMKGEGGFNMIELMVVVVIVGILAAIAVPIYSKYAKNARVTEATGKIGDILTAAKSYAVENEIDGSSLTATWPAGDCVAGIPNFVGDCTPSANFTYAISGGVANTDGTTLTITATGIGKMAGVTATMVTTNPNTNGALTITGI